MSSNQLSVPQVNVPSTITVSDADFAELARGSTFLGRLQLYTKGKAINQRLIGPGEYGVPESDESITVLGDAVDVIPLAKRAKALDMSDKDAIVQSFDPKSDVFQDIMARSNTPDSGCMYGVSFLIWVPSISRFLEYFAGTKTARSEAGKLFPFLPQPADGDKPAKPAQVVTLRSRLCEAGNFSWHAPVIKESSNPVTSMPSDKQLVDELTKFLNPKVDNVEKVDEATVAKRRAR